MNQENPRIKDNNCIYCDEGVCRYKNLAVDCTGPGCGRLDIE